MNNGQNGQSDESLSKTPLPTAPAGPGWGNSRCATQMNVTETSDTLRIQTTLTGLEPDSLVVTIRGPYFIVEGTIMYSGGRGRYARHVPELVNAREDYVDVTYQANGELTISLLKRIESSSDGHSDGRGHSHGHDGLSE
jgi:HSP20 family molecular chaperone IbpA